MTMASSQSAFVRGFIDDLFDMDELFERRWSLNPRSCAASSMTWSAPLWRGPS